MKKVFLISLAILSQSAFADYPPKSCPTPAAIQAVGLQKFEQGDSKGTWIVGVKANNYNTPDIWTFGITNIPAASGQQAMEIGAQQLTSLYGGVGPVMSPIGTYECLYSVKGGYWTVAFSPLDVDIKEVH